MEPDEGGVVYRTDSGRHSRSYLKALRPVAIAGPVAASEVHDLVIELTAHYADNSVSSADDSSELTYVEIDTFLESF